jgi:hypothetical protein
VKRRALLAGLPLWVSAAAAQPLQAPIGDVIGDRTPLNLAQLSAPSGGAPPSLDLSFMNGTLPPGVTFTRASTGTYLDASGTMQLAAANAPRFDHDPGTHAALGLLVEESRANSLLNSDTLNPTGNCVASTDIAPLHAGATLWKLTWPAGGGNGAIWGINLPIVIGTAYAASCWVYIPSAYNTAVDNLPEFNVDVGLNGTGGYNTGILADGTKRNQWQRLTGAVLAGTGGSTTCNLVIRRANAYGGASLGGSVCYLCCPQFEVGGFVSSYIPTGAAAVTRAEDFCSVPIGAWYSAAASTLCAESIHPVVSPSNFWQAIASIDDGIVTNRAQIYRVLNSNNVASQVTPTYNPTLGALTPGAVTKAAVATQNGKQVSALNGVVGGVGAVGTTLTGVTALNIGHSGSGTPLDGYIRRVRYWPRLLSAGELQTVTS